MTKKLRTEAIYIAPDILGKIDEFNNANVFDYRNEVKLDPNNLDDKIKIYERQVKDWFLIPAQKLLENKNANHGFIVLMICLSYFEGVEKYRNGYQDRKDGKKMFITALHRIYPDKYHENQLLDFYAEARCGLFHNGMVDGRILIKNDFDDALSFDNVDIKVNPAILLNDIMRDFNDYLELLKNDTTLRNNFNAMYTNL